MSKGVTVPEGIGILLPPGADIRHIEYQTTRFLLRLGSLGWCKFETLETATGQDHSSWRGGVGGWLGCAVLQTSDSSANGVSGRGRRLQAAEKVRQHF